MTEYEVKEAISQRSELKAQLRALLRLEKAAYKQTAADLENGELLDLGYKYIQGPSQALESNSEIIGSSKSKVCCSHLNTYHHLLMNTVKISVYKDPVCPSSSKRKANDEEHVPRAKRQVKKSFLKSMPASDT